MIEVNGMAHGILTVSQYEEAKRFYWQLMPALGLQPCLDEHAGERFVQGRVGLHHICFRARSREDVDRVASLLRDMNAHIVSEAKEGPWAPGYYYVLCEDPDGIRIEINHVPGQGVLAEDASFNPGGDWKK